MPTQKKNERLLQIEVAQLFIYGRETIMKREVGFIDSNYENIFYVEKFPL